MPFIPGTDSERSTRAVGRSEEIGSGEHPPACMRCVTFQYRAGPECHTLRWVAHRAPPASIGFSANQELKGGSSERHLAAGGSCIA
jgi:hypothetical protein